MDENAPPAVSITAIEVPFWNLVTMLIKVWFAAIIALAIAGAIPLIIVLGVTALWGSWF